MSSNPTTTEGLRARVKRSAIWCGSISAIIIGGISLGPEFNLIGNVDVHIEQPADDPAVLKSLQETSRLIDLSQRNGGQPR
jgi:hypothetical protein